MYTLNGIGPRLYGRYQTTSDGTYIATLWFTFVFIPIWPIAAFLVLPAPEGGWRFLSKTPFPPAAIWMRRVTAAATAVIAALAMWSSYWSGSHVDLHVYNGFDQPVVVEVADRARTVPAWGHIMMEELGAGNTSISAAWEESSGPFESFDSDLSGHGRETVTYNVASRGLLRLDYYAYGPDDPPEGKLLGVGPILFEDDVDYAFTTPPDSISVAEGATSIRSFLSAASAGVPAVNVVSGLTGLGRQEQALAVARAELTAYPENDELAYFTAFTLLGDDVDAQVELLVWCLDRAPDDVGLHRAYQELWPDDMKGTVREEYAALLAANPGSPMFHYLSGRLEDVASDEALSHYQASLDLEAEYPPTIRALGYRAFSMENWSQAITHYDRYASFGAVEALEVYEERTRLRRRLGKARSEMDGVLAETIQLNPEELGLDMLRAHLSVETEPGGLEQEVARIIGKATRLFGPDPTGALTRNVSADLLVTTGDPIAAGAELRQISDPDAVYARGS